jgi:hypothetical protein
MLVCMLINQRTINRKDTAPVLKDVSFSIASGQKIGIVGRTGRLVASPILIPCRRHITWTWNRGIQANQAAFSRM